MGSLKRSMNRRAAREAMERSGEKFCVKSEIKKNPRKRRQLQKIADKVNRDEQVAKLLHEQSALAGEV